jgi:hypothetical protein
MLYRQNIHNSFELDASEDQVLTRTLQRVGTATSSFGREAILEINGSNGLTL